MTPYLTKKDFPRPFSSMGFREKLLQMKENGKVPNGSRLIGNQKMSGKSVHFESGSTQPLHGSITAQRPSKKLFILRKSKKSKKVEPSSSEKNTPTPAYQLPAPPKSGNLSNRNEEENVYDLFAVCNHHGNMNRGHYIAYCKNPVEGSWFVYDDHHVLPIQDKEQLVSQHAYILFYLRRGAKMKLPGPTLDHTDTRAIVEKQHWIHSVPKYTLDLSQLHQFEGVRTSPRRQGSTGSAQPASMASGVSPPNAVGISPPNADSIFFGSHASTATYTAHSVSSAPAQHLTFFGSDSNGPLTLPRHGPANLSHPVPPPMTHTFPSPTGHTPQLPTFQAPPSQNLQPPTSRALTLPFNTLPPPTPTSPTTVLSQEPAHNTIPPHHLRRRAGSFHGTTRFGVGVSKQTPDGHSATRV